MVETADQSLDDLRLCGVGEVENSEEGIAVREVTAFAVHGDAEGGVDLKR